MENASKALLMAAEVLIGVMILTTMIVLFTAFKDMSREYNERLETQSIMQFNSQFTKYEGTNLKAQDVQTIANLVIEWNNTGTNETITLKMNGTNMLKVNSTTNKYKIGDSYQNFLSKNNEGIDVIDVVDEHGNPVIDENGKPTKKTIYPTYTMNITDYYESGRVNGITIRDN